MTDTEISSPLKRFIAEHISSVAELDLLLLLRSHAAREWTARDAANELRVEADWTALQLADLRTRGILTARETPEPLYRYAPGSPELDSLVAGLARLYTERRVTTITLIYSLPRAPKQVLHFADAFRLRKDR